MYTEISSNTQFIEGSREELLPGYTKEFPHIHTCYIVDENMNQIVPWHWHNPVELFYIESGLLEYNTPNGQFMFPAGSGGLLNSNVLHSTRRCAGSGTNVQHLHIFDPALIAGQQGSRIGQKYVTPLVSRSQLEMIPLYPENEAHRPALDKLRESYTLDEKAYGYELRLRAALSEIWLMLMSLMPEADAHRTTGFRSSDKLKTMMIHVHEHYAEKLSVAEIAASAYMSERECYRIFRDCLKQSPLEYLTSYRMQTARQLLESSDETITRVALACGFGSSSHFGKLFLERFGTTPLQYRRTWQDRDMNRR